MFEHLDDPTFRGFDSATRARVIRTARRRRNRTRGLALTAVAIPLLGIGAGALSLRNRVDRLDRVEIDGLASTASTDNAAPLSKPMTVLVVGTDRRSASDDGFGEVEGSRSDVVTLVHIDPVGHHLGILTIPSFLLLPGPTGDERAAVLGRDPNTLVQALTTYLDVSIDHYVEIEFSGFRRMVDLAGGVPVEFDVPQRDTQSGLAVDSGCVVLNGADALAFVRSIRLELFDSTSQRWVPDESGRSGRTARQVSFVEIMGHRVLTADYGPEDQLRLITDVFDDITVDEGLTIDTLRSIFFTARQIGPAGTEMVTLATHDAELDTIPVLRSDPDDVKSAVGRLLGSDDVESTPGHGGDQTESSAALPTDSDCGSG